MRISLKIFLLILVYFITASNTSAQIPNPGFETWMGGLPDGWLTTNDTVVTPVMIPVTQTSDAHTGNFAVLGTTLPNSTGTYPAIVSTSFPINSFYSSLNGWYKFYPVGGDSLQIGVYFSLVTDRTALISAWGFIQLGGTTSTYTQFTLPIENFTGYNVNHVHISIDATSNGSTHHAGTTFIIDDLSFGDPISVVESISTIPYTFALSQNFPNPFNPETTIHYALPSRSRVILQIFNLLGQKVTKLVDEEQLAGFQSVSWRPNGASGIYYYMIEAFELGNPSNRFVDIKKMILLR
jgi:hypothetical protein